MVEQEILTRVKTSDSFAAAYYLLYQSTRLIKFYTRSFPYQKREKKRASMQWVFVLEDVPVRMVEAYRNGNAIANVQDLKASRFKLKKALNL